MSLDIGSFAAVALLTVNLVVTGAAVALGVLVLRRIDRLHWRVSLLRGQTERLEDHLMSVRRAAFERRTQEDAAVVTRPEEPASRPSVKLVG